MTLGDKIRLARQKAKFSQEKLGEIIGVSKQAISLIEQGKTEKPDKRTLKLLVQTLNDDFGDPELNKYLIVESHPTKREIIEQTSVEEIFSIKFGGGIGTRTKEEIQKLNQLALQKLQEMKALNDE